MPLARAQVELRDAIMRAFDEFHPPKKKKPRKKPKDWVAGLDDEVSAAVQRRSLPHLSLKVRKDTNDRCSVRFGDKLMGMWKRGVRRPEDVEQGRFIWFLKPSALGVVWGMTDKSEARAEHMDAREVIEFTRLAMHEALCDPLPDLARWLEIYGLDITPDRGLVRKPSH